jgi:hypothetical protein
MPDNLIFFVAVYNNRFNNNPLGYIAFKIMVLERPQGGDRHFAADVLKNGRSSPTDNAPRIFILKVMLDVQVFLSGNVFGWVSV